MKNIEHREEYLKCPLKSRRFVEGCHPYQEQADLDFRESFLYILVHRNPTPPVADRGWGTPLSAFSKSDFYGQGCYPLSATGGVDFDEPKCTEKIRKIPSPPVPDGGWHPSANLFSDVL